MNRDDHPLNERANEAYDQQQANAVDLTDQQRAALSKLKSIEHTIRDHYAPSEAPSSMLETVRGGAQSHRRPLRLAPLALVAVLVLAASAWFLLPFTNQPTVDASLVHAGFISNPTPSVVCDTPEKLIDYTQETLGVGLTAEFDAGVTLIGWRTIAGSSYTQSRVPGALTPRVLLANGPDDEPIVVLFFPRGTGKPNLPDGSGLKLFNRSFESVRAWEVTPGQDATVLPLLSVAASE